MADIKNINVIILGFGNVGRELANQIISGQTVFKQRATLQLSVAGIADSSALIWNSDGLSPTAVLNAIQLKQKGSPLSHLDGAADPASIQAHLASDCILVDTSASNATLPLLLNAVRAQTGIVLANKIPLCSPWEQAAELFAYRRLRYESTVGAGLPVISTLNYLLNTGDSIETMTGCLSGTLGFLCSRLEQGLSYSEAVLQAKALGYTEPDPRQDLSGSDVARKAVILARTAGFKMEMADLSVEALYSPTLAELSVESFLAQAESENAKYSKLVQNALEKGLVPRYTAEVSSEGGKVGLAFPSKQSALGSLQGPNNYVSFKTRRYHENPLVISGPGAGVEVTAAGVLGDIVDLARVLS